MNKKIFLILVGLVLFFPNFVFAQENKLPYISGDSQILTQGYNTNFTHKAGTKDAFALDFTQNGCDGYGDLVLSVNDGEVFSAIIEKESGGYGNAVVVVDNLGIKNRYAHMINFMVSKGDKIKQGQLLGYQGDTGSVDGTVCQAHPGTHLHFAMYDSAGKAYKPEPMSAYNNFTAGKWYVSDNELYVEKPVEENKESKININEIGSIDLKAESTQNDSGGFWNKIGDFFSGLFESITGSISELADQLFISNDKTAETNPIQNVASENSSTVINKVEEPQNNQNDKNLTYALSFVSQSQSNLSLAPGQTTQVKVDFKNTGNQTWKASQVSLNVDDAKNLYAQKFYHTSWLTQRRTAKLDQVMVELNQLGSFSFTIQAPQNLVGQTIEIYFRPVLESNGKFVWLGTDQKVHWTVKILKPEEIKKDDEIKPGDGEVLGDKEEIIPEETPAEEIVEEKPIDEELKPKEEIIPTPEVIDNNQDNQGFQEYIRHRRGDSTPPSGEFYLSDIDSFSTQNTNNQEVKVNLTANEEIKHSFGTEEGQTNDNQPKLSDPSWLAELIKSFVLSIGDGLKTVYLWARDNANNISLFSSIIRLDTTAPSSTFNPAGEFQQNLSFPLSWQIVEDGSGVAYSQIQYRQNETDDWQFFNDGDISSETIETNQINFTSEDDREYYFQLRSVDLAGNFENWSEPISTKVKQVSQSEYLNIVINEVAWNGTKASANDEWLEIYNTTDNFIDLSSWKIKIGNNEFSLSGVIDGYDYKTISRTETANIIGSNPAKDIKINWSQELNDVGDYLELINTNGEVVDFVDCRSGWFAGGTSSTGTPISMERVNPSTSGSEVSNWGNATLSLSKIYYQDKARNDLVGTPLMPNTAIYTNNGSLYTKVADVERDGAHLTLDGSPYYIENSTTFYGDLIIDPGVLIRVSGYEANNYDGYKYLNVVNGKCLIKGTQEQPVIITSAFDTKYPDPISQTRKSSRDGYLNWGILRCYDGGEIDNTEFRFGSGVIMNDFGVITNSKFVGQDEESLTVASVPALQLTNNTFINTKQNRGEVVSLDTVIGVVENNNFYNAQKVFGIRNEIGLSIQNNVSNIPAYISFIKEYDAWSGNDYWVEVANPTYFGNNENIFYYLSGKIFVRDNLEIAPSNLVKMRTTDIDDVSAVRLRGGFRVQSDAGSGKIAKLIARDVIFTAGEDQDYMCPSSICPDVENYQSFISNLGWSNIDLYNDAEGIFENNIFRYGGAEDGIGNSASVLLNYESKTEIRNNLFQDVHSRTAHRGELYALVLSNPLAGTMVSGNTFDNVWRGLNVGTNVPVEIKNNNFLNNQTYRIGVSGRVGSNPEPDFIQLDLRENWWGDPTGPTRVDNPGGLGNKLEGSGPFDYSGWLMEVY
ncbi:MAG: peptidoglycan DD-metalloendopeptidase family protein [Patescibacteria group bacterium]